MESYIYTREKKTRREKIKQIKNDLSLLEKIKHKLIKIISLQNIEGFKELIRNIFFEEPIEDSIENFFRGIKKDKIEQITNNFIEYYKIMGEQGHCCLLRLSKSGI